MFLLPNIIYRFNSYVEPMPAIEYFTIGIDEIDRIRPLWEELNRHHLRINTRFRAHYEQMNFEERKAYFSLLCDTGLLWLDLATDPAAGTAVGYCAASVSGKKTGEIESLFIAPEYRSRGIGTALVTRALAWMGGCGAVQKRVSVSTGNEDTWPFYRMFGFYPRLTVLEQTGRQQ
jgi:GNAT superfamily N-acetyltransferase